MNTRKKFNEQASAPTYFVIRNEPENRYEWKLCQAFYNEGNANSRAKYWLKKDQRNAERAGINKYDRDAMPWVMVLNLSLGNHWSQNHPLNFFGVKGGNSYNGEMPSYIVDALRSIKREALQASRELKADAKALDLSTFEGVANYSDSVEIETETETETE